MTAGLGNATPRFACQNLWDRFQQVAVGSEAWQLCWSVNRAVACTTKIRRQTLAVGDFNSLPQTEIVEVQPLIESHNRTSAVGLDVQDDLKLARRTNE